MLILCRRTWLHSTFFNSYAAPIRYLRTRPSDATAASLTTPELLRKLKQSTHLASGPSNATRVQQLYLYRHLRFADRNALGRLALDEFLVIIQHSAAKRLPDTLNNAVADLLDFCSDASQSAVLHRILVSDATPYLRPPILLRILKGIQNSPDATEPLSVDDMRTLIRTFFGSDTSSADKELAQIITPLLLECLHGLPRPHGDFVFSYKPPLLIKSVFLYIEKLLRLDDQALVLKLFQFLVNTAIIPPEAVQTIPGFTDFGSIVRSSLARACTYWRWCTLAKRFLVPLIESHPTKEAKSLVVDSMYAMLPGAKKPDLVACLSLIKQLHEHGPVPHGLFRQFYDAAVEAKAGAEAQALYAFSRSDKVRESHEYPCPRGRPLPWLVIYLLRGHSLLAKELANEIVMGNIPIAVEHRSHLVSYLASSGHAILARTLWSRFAIGKDRNFFVGDSSLILRTLSLFQSLIHRAETLLARDPKNEVIRGQLEDKKEFAAFILDAYIQANEPLQEAPHSALSSLARCYFIAGRYMDGFETVKILLARKDLPDLYDVNIVLGAIAGHDPREAVKVLKRMKERGLQPDGVSYGTVIHRAIERGDHALVSELAEEVRNSPAGQLTHKGMVALIRGTLEDSVDNQLTQRAKLKSVWRMMSVLPTESLVGSTDMGKLVVRASVRAQDPVMAYRFWDLLLRHKTRWTDIEQIGLRKGIAMSLEKHREMGWAGERACRIMIGVLSRKE
ncbi:Golgi reassembly stacking protein 2 [Mycena kentingensis (nom. inval.)]|nr:Golgi reassembly stacking protein 2 [Mycena kentingensis (nom. inval.)]